MHKIKRVAAYVTKSVTIENDYNFGYRITYQFEENKLKLQKRSYSHTNI